ncbi:hypothetical protein A4H97_14460 [Niastella yeongjuensis]|uniref:Lipoprotein n=1 Tax=Niastella yeongjuensis TaxID=354355 RepID=A0A1V9E3Y4_9BACT|nr:hypothetical protein [Niastella yeongjuensis]OQP40812.1 hypothetical protein A4H97_14460 [Niastella yeongjuensis]SEP00928.1 hypothetical protein SAMN05660816_04162 [Niastella yeongjuensis]
MKSTHFLFLLGLLAACNSQPKDKEKETEAKAEQPASHEPTVNCYQYATATDTVRLTLVHVGDNINGMLIYQLKEKDRNVGSINGTMNGDILLADYTFKSEGTQSTRQVAFKKAGNAFIEGYGESAEVNGVEKFKNVDSIVFSSSMKLEEIPCK